MLENLVVVLAQQFGFWTPSQGKATMSADVVISMSCLVLYFSYVFYTLPQHFLKKKLYFWCHDSFKLLCSLFKFPDFSLSLCPGSFTFSSLTQCCQVPLLLLDK